MDRERKRGGVLSSAARRILLGALCIVGELALIGCSTAQMVLPPHIAENKDFHHVDRPSFTSGIGKQTWTLGPFKATEVDLGVTSKSTTSVGSFSSSRSQQKFSFTLSGPSQGGAWKGFCETGVAEKGKSIGGLELTRSSTSLTCHFASGGEGAGGLEIAIADDGKEGDLLGKMTYGDAGFEISMTKKVQGGLSRGGPSGYFFAQGEESLGAIDVVGPGIIFLKTDADEATRFAVAAAATALLIFSS